MSKCPTQHELDEAIQVRESAVTDHAYWNANAHVNALARQMDAQRPKIGTAELQAKVSQLKQRIKNQEAVFIESREREVALRDQLKLYDAKLSGEFWVWQGDGEDDLNSLTCPVLIPAEILRKQQAIIDKLPKYAADDDRAGQPFVYDGTIYWNWVIIPTTTKPDEYTFYKARAVHICIFQGKKWSYYHGGLHYYNFYSSEQSAKKVVQSLTKAEPKRVAFAQLKTAEENYNIAKKTAEVAK